MSTRLATTPPHDERTASARLSGIVPPLVTPLTDPNTLDTSAVNRLVDRLVDGGVAGLFVLGTTGEGPALSYAVREAMIAQTVSASRGRLPVLVGVTDPSLPEAVWWTQRAKSLGATAVVSAPPYYFSTPNRLVGAFWRELAEASPLPVYLYNMPSCTGVAIDLITVEQCTTHPNIVGLKDSAGDLPLLKQFLTLRAIRPDWSFFVGPEHLLQEAMQLGVDGGVHAGANFAPELFVAWYQACRTGDWATAEELRRRVIDLGRIYDVGGDTLGVTRGAKAALARQGICSNVVVGPFLPLNDEQQGLVERFLHESLSPGDAVQATGDAVTVSAAGAAVDARTISAADASTVVLNPTPNH
jgi:2-dehydro-3-deoxy-D-pentonate aldolase